MKTLLLILSALLLFSCGEKKLTYQEQVEEEQRKEQMAKNILSDQLCKLYRDSAFIKFVGKDFKIDSSKLKKITYNSCMFFDNGSFTGNVKGVYGAYTYSLEVNVYLYDSTQWHINNFMVKDGEKLVLQIENEKESDVSEYNKKVAAYAPKIKVTDKDIVAVRKAIQKEWDASNAASPVGAESSVVSNVKKVDVFAYKVRVSYTLRSTFYGVTKEQSFEAIVEKSSNGSWEVVELVQ